MLMQSLYTMRALVGLVDHAYYGFGVGPPCAGARPPVSPLMDFVTIRTEGSMEDVSVARLNVEYKSIESPLHPLF